MCLAVILVFWLYARSTDNLSWGQLWKKLATEWVVSSSQNVGRKHKLRVFVLERVKSVINFTQRFPNSSRWPERVQGKHCGARTVPALRFGCSRSRHQKQFQIPLECLFISSSVCYDPHTLSPVQFTFLSASPSHTPVILEEFGSGLNLISFLCFFFFFCLNAGWPLHARLCACLLF